VLEESRMQSVFRGSPVPLVGTSPSRTTTPLSWQTSGHVLLYSNVRWSSTLFHSFGGWVRATCGSAATCNECIRYLPVGEARPNLTRTGALTGPSAVSSSSHLQGCDELKCIQSDTRYHPPMANRPLAPRDRENELLWSIHSEVAL
jgi:hypothetical protein